MERLRRPIRQARSDAARERVVAAALKAMAAEGYQGSSLARIAAALRAGIDAGEIRPDVGCDALAAEIIAMMDGLQVQWLLDPDGVDMAAVFADYIQGVRRAITIQPTDTSTAG